jgi:hypothetical protein
MFVERGNLLKTTVMKKLFMILVGFKPKGYLTEQHDIVFVVLDSYSDREAENGDSKPSESTKAKILKAAPPVPPGTEIHVDAYVEIMVADQYSVTVAEGPAKKSDRDLYFANLGGYKIDDFQEYHKKLLLVLADESQIKSRAAKDSFFTEMDKIKNASPHVDDRHRLNAEVEDKLKVVDVLEGYHLVFELSVLPNSITKPVIRGYDVIGVKS